MDFSKFKFVEKGISPEKGDCLAIYRATAELSNCPEKDKLITLLFANSVQPAMQYCRKVFFSCEESTCDLLLEIASDLESEKNVSYVQNKAYRFTVEYFFYANPSDVPEDTHWTLVDIAN